MLMVKKEWRESWKKLLWFLRFSSVVFSWSRRRKVFKPIIKRSSVRTWIRTRLISAHWNCTINRKILNLETLLKDAPSRIESNGTLVLFYVKRTVWLYHKFGVQQKLAVNKCLVIENICHRNCKLSEIWLLCVKVRSARTEHSKWKGEKIRKLADCIIAWLGCVNVLNR